MVDGDPMCPSDEIRFEFDYGNTTGIAQAAAGTDFIVQVNHGTNPTAATPYEINAATLAAGNFSNGGGTITFPDDFVPGTPGLDLSIADGAPYTIIISVNYAGSGLSLL